MLSDFSQLHACFRLNLKLLTGRHVIMNSRFGQKGGSVNWLGINVVKLLIIIPR